MTEQLQQLLASLSPAAKIALGMAATALLPLFGGKFIRSLFILPFKKIAEKTSTQEDDILVKAAEQDLGIEQLEKRDATIDKE